jgi:RNA polymerase sigma-70 factor (ECF subfamily)
VKVEVVNRTRLDGRSEASRYFSNYSQSSDWRLVAGLVERRPAVLVQHPDDPAGIPLYFILLDWSQDRLLKVRDFRYARYVIDGAELIKAL